MKYYSTLVFICAMMASSFILRAQNPNTSVKFVIQNSQPAQVSLGIPNSGVTSYSLIFPGSAGSAGSVFFASNATNQLSWLTPGADGSLMTVSSGMPAWVSASSLLGSSFVLYGTSTAQIGAADRSKYLFNVAYASGAPDASAAGAVITSVGGSSNRNANGLQITSTASGTATAIGISVCASGGANNYAAVFPCGSVGVGISTPDPSASFDDSSTTSGALLPRMTSSQRSAISAPATGLLVYQTNGNSGFYYYDGSAWEWLHADSSVGSIRFLRKSASQTVNTALLVGAWNADNDLSITFDSNQIWELDILSFITPAGLLGLTINVGINITNGMGGAMYANTPTTGLLGVGASTGSSNNNMSSGTTEVASLNVNALGILGSFVIITKGFVTTGSSAGTATVEWRGSGLLSSFNINQNSYLKATRLQ